MDIEVRRGVICNFCINENRLSLWRLLKSQDEGLEPCVSCRRHYLSDDTWEQKMLGETMELGHLWAIFSMAKLQGERDNCGLGDGINISHHIRAAWI